MYNLKEANKSLIKTGAYLARDLSWDDECKPNERQVDSWRESVMRIIQQHKAAHNEIKSQAQQITQLQQQLDQERAANRELARALDGLVHLKEYEDVHGKDEHYLQRQPMQWGAARQAIADNPDTERYQAERKVIEAAIAFKETGSLDSSHDLVVAVDKLQALNKDKGE